MSILSCSTQKLPAVFKDKAAWRRRADFGALSAWLVATFFLAFTSWQSPGHDFRGYYAAAQVLTAGGNPYDYRQLAPVLLSVTGHMGNNPYYYPPWFAWCFTPICWLSFKAARATWLLFNSAVWIFALCQLGKITDWPSPGWRRWLTFLLLTYIFAGITLQFEQIGIILFAIFIAVISAVRKSHWHWTGFLLALLLVKPNITSIPVMAITAWLARSGQWRPALVMTMSIASLLLVTTIATPGWYEPFFQPGFGRGLTVGLDGPNRIVSIRINTTLLDWLRMFQVGASLRQGIYAFALVSGMTACAYTVRKSASILPVISGSVLIGFMVTPYAVQYDYPPLALVWILVTASASATTRPWCWAFIGTIFVTGAFIWERPISDGYWVVIGLIALSIWSWRQLVSPKAASPA